jgi:hypothetical protein
VPCEGFNLLLNHGPATGQKPALAHLHLHLVPRTVGDSVRHDRAAPEVSREALDAVAADIRRHVQKGRLRGSPGRDGGRAQPHHEPPRDPDLPCDRLAPGLLLCDVAKSVPRMSWKRGPDSTPSSMRSGGGLTACRTVRAASSIGSGLGHDDRSKQPTRYQSESGRIARRCEFTELPYRYGTLGQVDEV